MVKINVALLSYIFFLFIFNKSINAQSKNIPDNLPLHTKILWGENGILRKINFIPKNRNAELKLRVQMLQLHQKLSLGTMFLFGYQSYLGNQMVNGDYSKHDLHSSLSRYVWSSYMISAGLSYLAPPALKYSKRKDSMTFHRYLSHGFTFLVWRLSLTLDITFIMLLIMIVPVENTSKSSSWNFFMYVDICFA